MVRTKRIKNCKVKKIIRIIKTKKVIIEPSAYDKAL
jgi:hypothetical protein